MGDHLALKHSSEVQLGKYTQGMLVNFKQVPNFLYNTSLQGSSYSKCKCSVCHFLFKTIFFISSLSKRMLFCFLNLSLIRNWRRHQTVTSQLVIGWINLHGHQKVIRTSTTLLWQILTKVPVAWHGTIRPFMKKIDPFLLSWGDKLKLEWWWTEEN